MDIRIGGTDLTARLPDELTEAEIKEAIRNYLDNPRSLEDNVQDALTRPQSTVREYKPPLGERVSRTIGNALFDTGLISDRYAANQIGRNLGMGAEALPIIGDAVGGDDLGRAIAEGTKTDVAVAGLGAIPVVGELASAIVPAVLKNRKGADYDYESLLEVFNKDKSFDMASIEPDPEKVPPIEAPNLKVSEGYQPANTVKGYKLFRTDDDGKLYPLFVNKEKEVPVGVWEDATAGERVAEGTPRKGQNAASSTEKVKSSLGPLAYRPGWHAGDSASATHIGGKATKEPLPGGPTTKSGKAKVVPQYRPANQVWAEVEMPNDVDWQAEALKRSERTKAGTVNVQTAEIKDQVPYGGFYKYKTNPNMAGQWMISGNVKVNRGLSNDEVKQVGEMTGIPDLPTLPEFLDQNPDLKLEDMTQSATNELKKYYPDYYDARFGAGKDTWTPPESQTDVVLRSASKADAPDSDFGAIDQGISEVPVITPDMLKGKTIKPTLADLTGAGRTFQGLDSSTIEPVELQGGPGFPLLESYRDDGIVWAADDMNAIKKLQGSDYVVVSAMGKDAHLSNATFSKSFMDSISAFVRDGRIPEQNALELDKIIRSQKGMSDFPGLENPDEYVKWTRDMSFDQRKALMRAMGSAKAQDLGAPNMERIRNELIDEGYAGSNLGDGLIVIRVDQGPDAAVELGKNGTKEHRSYKYGVKGEVVGKFARPVSMQTLFPDTFDQRAMYGKPVSGDFRSFQMGLPTQQVDARVAQNIPTEAIEGIASPRQAQLADDFMRGQWRTTDNAVNAGGVSITDFTKALRANPMAATLTQFDTPQKLSDLKKNVKSGKTKIFRLGDNEVYFGIQNDYDYGAEYDGFDAAAAGLSPNEKVLTGVIGNEVGAPGISGPAVMTKAIEEGVTALDAFKVKTPRNPNGFLPEMYSQYGFEEVGTIPFNESYYTDVELNDLKTVFRKQGWQDGDPMPEVSIMKYKGNDNERTNYTQRWISQSIGDAGPGFNAGAADQFTAAADDAIQTNVGRQSPQGPGDARVDTGSVSDGNRIPAAERAAGAVRAVAGLNDAQRRELGLPTNAELQYDSVRTDQQRSASEARTQSIRNRGGVRGGSWVLDEQSGAITEKSGAKKPLYTREQDGALNSLPRDVPGFDVKPNVQAAEVARKYMARAGQGADYQPINKYMPIDPKRGAEIAKLFDEMDHDPDNPQVKAAYDALAEETLEQYDEILKTGFVPEFIPSDMGDPYGNPRNAIEDINQNNHMWVFPTDDGFGGEDDLFPGNPLLADSGYTISGKPATVNDIFRVVHDYFGHVKEGLGFRAGGEDNAFRSHAAMYSPLARRALATETRGQNSYVNFGPNAEFNRTANGADTQYAPQKVGLLPEWVSESFGDAYVDKSLAQQKKAGKGFKFTID